MDSILYALSSILKFLLGTLVLLVFGLGILLQHRRTDELWPLVLPAVLLLLLLFGRRLYRWFNEPALLRGLFIPESRFRTVKRIGLAVVFALAVRACAYSEYTWKEELLLHDGSNIMVERTNDYWMLHTFVLQFNSQLVKRTLRFRIPGTFRWASWVTTYSKDPYHPTEDLGLEAISLDFLDGIPYVATVTDDCLAYRRLGQPNPPYFFFKYVGYISGWQRIPLAEFPQQFKVNMISDTDRYDVRMDKKEYGFLRAETVANKIKQELKAIDLYTHKYAGTDSEHSWRHKLKYYSIIRVPFKQEDLRCEERLYRCGNNSVITLPSLKPDLTCEEVK